MFSFRRYIPLVTVSAFTAGTFLTNRNLTSCARREAERSLAFRHPLEENNLALVGGSSSKQLAFDIAKCLGTNLTNTTTTRLFMCLLY